MALHADRVRVQGGRGAVPHVGARRVRGRADADHGVHGRHGEGGRVRGAPAGLDGGVSDRVRRMASGRRPASPSPRWSSATPSALAQRNIKRMLAYSSIAHAGFLLVALAAGSDAGRIGDAVLSARVHAGDVRRLRRRHRALAARATAPVMIDDFAGLWSVRPWLALGMGVLMLSHARLPGVRRRRILRQVVRAAGRACRRRLRRRPLAVVLVLTTVVSAGYYLYVVMVMFMKPRPEGAAVPGATPGLTRAVVRVQRDCHPVARHRAGPVRAPGAGPASCAASRPRP